MDQLAKRRFVSRRYALLLALCATTAVAQEPPGRGERPVPIQDNSFLVEEAYNQGPGIVQHISTFARSTRGGGWGYAFTQEWPVPGQRHQLSYTLPISRTDGDGSARYGLGDVAVNYRYQIGGEEGDATAFAPRVTLVLPTGASTRGFGAGGTGMQINLPFSAELPASLVAHSNAGATYTPRARDPLGNVARAVDYGLGQSVIWLAHPKLNLMLEGVWTRVAEVIGPGRTERSTEVLLSPGIRGALDLPSGLQIVPGIAFPIGVGPSRGERSVFVYLSFEHPFHRAGAVVTHR